MSDATFEVDKDNLEVTITRLFKATPERMWQAHTDPEQIPEWWADTKVDKFEFKVGGVWRFVSNGQDGNEYAFNGVFKELDEPNKIVRTFEYEPWAGHVMTESVTFEPMPDGKTKQTTISKYENIDDLEGMVGSGMERGATTGLDRLAMLVERDTR
jgi:uncharacterized protein YndB with AHSA1/START domain